MAHGARTGVRAPGRAGLKWPEQREKDESEDRQLEDGGAADGGLVVALAHGEDQGGGQRQDRQDGAVSQPEGPAGGRLG